MPLFFIREFLSRYLWANNQWGRTKNHWLKLHFMKAVKNHWEMIKVSLYTSPIFRIH
ncbi:hypothetical protein BACI71_120213 [Bacillus mycoides]|uniref:Transposase n=1 Tax=Bacillus mycoides TaxID=1405 RepID=A0A653SWQ2_BACMY|nr:hypothetical protein BACI71_120213 [Bacillus mycoides]